MADLRPENPYVPERIPDPEKKVVFPPEALRKFEQILERYPTRQAAMLPTLHLVQETWGWISPEAIVYVGELLDQTPAAVFGIVSFYNMYNQRPVGKYHLQVCTNLSCMLRNAYGIYERICERLAVRPGENTKDGRFTVTEVECLGSCGTAPVVQINHDYHEDLTVETMEQILGTLK
ncbi:MAG TPA: NAD(P)H-dependent oxidoreductase subunit E [Thermoanaerobaculia bacterium]|nr:NAD(P)H-dependent oxidoreductase subunit E [Thermoanaerobaculia bacterium]